MGKSDNNQNIGKDNNIDIKNKDKYHHGDLRETMIRTGAKLLAEDGTEKFSLRKLASMCNVSHAAPYKHFKNKDEIISAIGEYIEREFTEALMEVVDIYKDDPMKKITELGKRYVSFMVENKDYLKLLFLNPKEHRIEINVNEMKKFNYAPFQIFRECALEALRYMDSDPKEYGRNIIAMWSTVHGLAIMLSNNTIVYDGNYLELVEQILTLNMKLQAVQFIKMIDYINNNVDEMR